MVDKKPESKGRPSVEVDVVTLKNIGPQSAKWLAAVGIHTKKDLEDVGAVNAFRLMRSHGYNVTPVMLYALQGALMDLHWNRLPGKLKDDLRARARADEQPR
ncbi:MAG: TfoX/Sxy family protein [Betaproteobacteria bacterium]|jgi:DNA transformation protein|nr:TfoX/Sxy family protein [Rhodocyclaceae bacterium]MCA3134872.1 TfoX/Sxy family protein [Rhodocyclaceae bacterium]MCA3142354.1 TfoX/Sxy family protein [Rhodocyclaceae bacterium]MCA3146357.1 TfoX/Sxy family protein [Rhodocyclaceae bacterium]MCE2899504.1 TfoX/Sxy family protein [Betaproteobacteria bacterium]